MGLYLRFGVDFQAQTFEVEGTLQLREPVSGVRIERSELTDEIVDLDTKTVGFNRRIDRDFLATNRPLYRASVDNIFVGYAFGSNGSVLGPAAVVDATFFPGFSQLSTPKPPEPESRMCDIRCPGLASSAIRWALDAGHPIDPFYEVLLADSPNIPFDPYLMTHPGFIW